MMAMACCGYDSIHNVPCNFSHSHGHSMKCSVLNFSMWLVSVGCWMSFDVHVITCLYHAVHDSCWRFHKKASASWPASPFQISAVVRPRHLKPLESQKLRRKLGSSPGLETCSVATAWNRGGDPTGDDNRAYHGHLWNESRSRDGKMMKHYETCGKWIKIWIDNE